MQEDKKPLPDGRGPVSGDALLTEPRALASGVSVSPMGLGTWQWSDYFLWSPRAYSETDLREAFHASLKGGINFIDTAEIYGRGHSERLLGEFLPEAGQPVVVATKFMPLPWRLRRSALVKALRASLKRLRLERVDLYQIHWPFRPRAIEVWAEALADAIDAGLTRAVGVSNYSADQMSRAHEVLSKRGVPLASNQVRYNLLDRSVERNGVLHRCRELGVTLIAYSPLAKGRLTGKRAPDNPLIRLMRETGRPPTQVALNWLLTKGVVPIPGARNGRQAAENAAALSWRLTPEQVTSLEQCPTGPTGR